MHRHDSDSAIGVTEEVVAALDSRDGETGPPQGREDLTSGDPRKPSHATVIFWTPMKSRGSTLSPWTSRQSSTASRTLVINSSRDLACVDRKSTRLNSSHVRISYAV